MCNDLLFEDTGKLEYRDCSLNPLQFRKLLTLAVKDTHFVFNKQLFAQVDGVATESPLGPTLANIFMNTLEKKYLANCPSEYKPVLYRRYVDDTFCSFRNKNVITFTLSSNYTNRT